MLMVSYVYMCYALFSNLLVMDSGKGDIYVFNSTTPWPYKPVISGLMNASGLTVDYYSHMMYWYSDKG